MKYTTSIISFIISFVFILSTCMAGMTETAQEQTMMGAVVKRGKDFVIEAEDGDYIVKGKDISKFAGKLVIVSGIITQSSKGDVIEIKTIEDIQDTMED
jgi:hypothetical protein